MLQGLFFKLHKLVDDILDTKLVLGTIFVLFYVAKEKTGEVFQSLCKPWRCFFTLFLTE